MIQEIMIVLISDITDVYAHLGEHEEDDVMKWLRQVQS